LFFIVVGFGITLKNTKLNQLLQSPDPGYFLIGQEFFLLAASFPF